MCRNCARSDDDEYDEEDEDDEEDDEYDEEDEDDEEDDEYDEDNEYDYDEEDGDDGSETELYDCSYCGRDVDSVDEWGCCKKCRVVKRPCYVCGKPTKNYCLKCNRVVCLDHATEKRKYCQNCYLKACHICFKHTMYECNYCKDATCYEHLYECGTCNEWFCEKHISVNNLCDPCRWAQARAREERDYYSS